MSYYVCFCVCVYVRVCVCACVCEREREREKCVHDITCRVSVAEWHFVLDLWNICHGILFLHVVSFFVSFVNSWIICQWSDE